MRQGKPYALYVDGRFVSKVRGLEQAQLTVLKLGEALTAGQRLTFEVKLENRVVWEGDLEASALPDGEV